MMTTIFNSYRDLEERVIDLTQKNIELKTTLLEFLNPRHRYIYYRSHPKLIGEICILCEAEVIANSDDEDFDEMILRLEHHKSCPLYESKSTP